MPAWVSSARLDRSLVQLLAVAFPLGFRFVYTVTNYQYYRSPAAPAGSGSPLRLQCEVRGTEPAPWPASPHSMETSTRYRFRILTRDSVGAYTLVDAASQSQALSALLQQLAPWESAAPLHGPSQCPQWFG